VADIGPSSTAWTLHETLLELLRRLNQAHSRAGEVEGLEFPEVQRAMHPFWATQMHEVDLHFALQLLVENGLAQVVDQPAYAWDRNRVLGERFLITTQGKSYLHQQVEASGRIP
jgi:hypothetical protein